ncbi:response regulator [Salegentibacter sp. HM20]
MQEATPLQILIAEDDPVITRLQEYHLHRLTQLPVSTFWNGKELTSFLNNLQNPEKTAFLLFLDLNMPLMNGWEVLDFIEQNLPDFPVFIVVLTSSLNPKDEAKAKAYKQVIGFHDKFLEREDFRNILQSPQLTAITSAEILKD